MISWKLRVGRAKSCSNWITIVAFGTADHAETVKRVSLRPGKGIRLISSKGMGESDPKKLQFPDQGYAGKDLHPEQ